MLAALDLKYATTTVNFSVPTTRYFKRYWDALQRVQGNNFVIVPENDMFGIEAAHMVSIVTEGWFNDQVLFSFSKFLIIIVFYFQQLHVCCIPI